ncbi:MAG: O-antigen ligase family protein [Geminicoccaceae bacterium]
MPTATMPFSTAPRPEARGIFAPRTLLSDACSFEAVFLLYLYSNAFQLMLPKLPIDMTYIWLGLSALVGFAVIAREGFYLPGLVLCSAALPWLAWVNLSTLWTPSHLQVWTYLKLLNFVNVWCLIAGAMIIAHKRERMLRFMKIMIFFSVIVACVGAGIYIRYGSFKFAGWVDAGRVYNNWGRATANGAVILTLLALRARMFSMHQIFTGGLLAVCVFFILISSSRSALLCVATPCLLYLMVTFLPGGRKGLSINRGALLLPLILVLVGAILAAAIGSGYKVDSVARMGKVVAQSDDPDMVTGANRWAYYAAAIKLIFESPVVGHGARSFAPLYKQNEVEGTQPHNIFLEILSDTGFVGLVLFLFFLYVAWRPMPLQRLRSDPMALAVAMLFISRFTAVQFGADLSSQQEIFVFIGLLAIRGPEPDRRPALTGWQADPPPNRNGAVPAGGLRSR